ncbi:MAG: hypothetical protein NT084_05890 [Bacteroidetes bacterium]|nr:hypothetical protein [Bacteroidota bacterium]
MKVSIKIILQIVFIGLLFTSCKDEKTSKDTHNAKGVLTSRDFFVNGKLIHSISFYPNGAKAVEKLFDETTGLMSGPYVEFYDDGSIKKKGKAAEGQFEDTMFVYYRQNRLQEIGIYKNGKKNGRLLFYHFNGNIGAAGMYVNDSMDGKWTIYDDNGFEIGTNEYVKGNLISGAGE